MPQADGYNLVTSIAHPMIKTSSTTIEDDEFGHFRSALESASR